MRGGPAPAGRSRWWAMGERCTGAGGADVGMAMGGNGTDVAMHAAGITLMRGDPAWWLAALDISDRTVAKIRQNLFWAFVLQRGWHPAGCAGFLEPGGGRRGDGAQFGECDDQCLAAQALDAAKTKA